MFKNMNTASQAMELYLVTTDHLEDRIWFRDEEDFKAGMNTVAILAAVAPTVHILAFTLMSNHVHFVLECSYEEATSFINAFKKYHSRYLHCKYGFKETLRGNHVDIQRINLTEDSPERVIAYVLMNCVAANICLYPADYPWGTGNIYFRMTERKGRRIGTLSKREQVRVLHSKAYLPADYILGEDGYILPESYTKVSFVEALFHTPKRMLFFLQNSSKAKQRIESNDQMVPAFKDQLIISAIPDLCHSLFRKNKLSDLTPEQRIELLRQIHYRFSANINQIGRVSGLPYEEVVKQLDSF